MTLQADESVVDSLKEFYDTYYSDEISTLVQLYPRESRSLEVTFGDLSSHDMDLADDYLFARDQINQWLVDALVEYVDDLPVDINFSNPGVEVRVTSLLPEDTYGVGELRTHHGTQFLGVRGQLSTVSGVRSRLVEAVFECQRCGGSNTIPQPFGRYQEAHECNDCERQGPFELNFNRSEFTDQVVLKVEQPPDEAASSSGNGQEVVGYVEGDLVDPDSGDDHSLADHAGDRVVVNGVLEFDKTDLQGQNATPVLDTYLNVESIEFEDDSLTSVDIGEHKEEFTTLAGREDVHTLLRESVAPEIHADEKLLSIFDAAVLYLFGAHRKDPEDGPTYRGDIHMLLVGDPGTAKSTIASNINELSPRSEFVSGTDVTGSGLTAAAVREDFGFGESQWTLNPGVLPRANGGHAIIDEIDKSDGNAAERMHDALEGDQQVRISKAGIQANLNTRCGLLASGNPTHGRFDSHESISEQINLDPALISRFDLIFVLKDKVDRELDTKISGHLLTSIQEASGSTTTTTHQRAQTDGGTASGDSSASSRPVSADVLRAWVAYARQNVFPTLPDGEPKERLTEYYQEVRDLNGGYDDGNGDEEDVAIPATARSLMATSRLAEASARARLSDEVSIDDVERAIDIHRKTIGGRYDSKSGEFDVNTVDNSVTKNQKDRRESLIEILRDMQREDEYKDSGVPYDDLSDALEAHGIDTSTFKKDVEHKKTETGELYEPRTGRLKATK